MEPVLISALEHWAYCPRQCGLIHLEGIWDENVFTIRGTGLHQRADTPMARVERGRRVERALPIWSVAHGLQGRADVVEFLRDGTPVPIETKSGKASERVPERVQLCAQALCLEEMFGRAVPEGFVFYAASAKRVSVAMDEPLREETLATVAAVRAMLSGSPSPQRGEGGRGERGPGEAEVAFPLPPARYDRRCRNCSLLDACLPQGLARGALVRKESLFVPRKEAELP